MRYDKSVAKIILPNSNDRHSLDTILTCSVSNVITTVLSLILFGQNQKVTRGLNQRRE